MTITNARLARQVVNSRLRSYVASVKDQLPTGSVEFWQRIEPVPDSQDQNSERWEPRDRN
jgi:hypothetical protein